MVDHGSESRQLLGTSYRGITASEGASKSGAETWREDFKKGITERGSFSCILSLCFVWSLVSARGTQRASGACAGALAVVDATLVQFRDFRGGDDDDVGYL